VTDDGGGYELRARLRSKLKRFLRAEWEWVLVILIAPLLMFPTQFPYVAAGALLLLVAVWVGEWCANGLPALRTPLAWSWMLLGVMVLVGVWASAVPDLTFPKLTGIVLGMVALRAILLGVRAPHHLWRALGIYLLVGLGLVMLGALGTPWKHRLPSLVFVYSLIPRRFSELPGTVGGVNANALGGTTLFFIPLLSVLCASWWRIEDVIVFFWPGRPACGVWGWRGWNAVLKGAVLALALALVGVLVLSQSRTAWIALCITLALLAALRYRWARWALLVALLVGVAFVAYVGPGRFSEALVSRENDTALEAGLGGIGLAARVELWSRALYAIQDFPFTGCGLGTFRQVTRVLYPLFLIPPDIDVAHAHNVFLQVALDVGLPGLIAYLSLLIAASLMCWQVYRKGEPELRALALGLWGSLVAIHLFGLADAFVLGAKVGVFFWFALGLIAAAHGMMIRPEKLV
jgi:putative inorganic carbon (HCO3(-)) transporter